MIDPPPIQRLIRTKLYVPRAHPDLIDRPRLIQKLNDGLHAKVVLITAPAGYGKTTLLSAWIQQSGLPVAWVSLDTRDDDPPSFWSYFIAALQSLQPGVGNIIIKLLHSQQAPPQDLLLGTLLNEICLIQDEFLFVLDDYHTITSPDIQSGVSYLLAHLPPNMHFVITSRADPPLPLPLLRARREMVEVHLADLRFTTQEATSLFNTLLQLDLSSTDILALEQATEGWAAGLHLAALSMQGIEDTSSFIRSFSGNQRYIFDYLAQEVLERQTPDIQEFLIKTSILERMNGSLCDFILDKDQAIGPTMAGLPRSTEILEYLERANLFLIPLDTERRWYRYHHLFSDFLYSTLEASSAEIAINALHGRASQWYEHNGFLAEAIEHAMGARDYPRTADLIHQVAEDMFLRSELVPLRNWLNLLPAEQVSQEASLSIIFAWVLLATGQYNEMEPHLQDAERLLGIPEDGYPIDKYSPVDIDVARGEIACLRASQAINRFDLEEALYQGQLAQAYLAGKSGYGLFNNTESLRGIVPFTLAIVHELTGEVAEASQEFEESIALSKDNFHLLPMAYTHLAYLKIIQGKLRQAEASYRQAMQVAERSSIPSPLSAVAHTGMGNLFIEWNDLAQAENELKRGLDLGRQWAYLDSEISGITGLVRWRLVTGDIEGAQELIAELTRFTERTPVALPTVLLDSLQAKIWIRQKNLKALQEWVSRIASGLDGTVPYMLEDQAIILARGQIALGQFQQAFSLIDRLLPATRTGNRGGKSLELHLLQSLAWFQLGNSSLACEILDEVLATAEAEGYKRLFLDEGEPMEGLLTTYARQPAARFQKYTQSLLFAFKEEMGRRKTGNTNFASGGTPDLLEPLSDRELEVLGLIASGMSNQEISDRLVVSPNTVKSHIKNIFGKLGANSRTRAIARARDAGLIQ